MIGQEILPSSCSFLKIFFGILTLPDEFQYTFIKLYLKLLVGFLNEDYMKAIG